MNKVGNTIKNVNVIFNKTKESGEENRLYYGSWVSREGLKSYLEKTFAQYGISSQIPIAESVISCESSWRWWASNYISKGVAQFTAPTWKEYCSGNYNAMNPVQQINCMATMWKLGLEKRWDCYREIVKNYQQSN